MVGGAVHTGTLYLRRQRSIKRFREGEGLLHRLNLWWQANRARVTRQRADLCARSRQSRDDLAADGAGPSNNENTIHVGLS